MEKTLQNEKDFLLGVATAMDLMGFQTAVLDSGEYPVSIESKLLGYEDMPIDLVLLFLPTKDLYDDEAQILQIYFSLYDCDIDVEKFEELKSRFNYLNMSTAVGTFGVQEHIFKACFKQGVLIPAGTRTEVAMKMVMQNLTLMALALDSCYEDILAIIEED